MSNNELLIKGKLQALFKVAPVSSFVGSTVALFLDLHLQGSLRDHSLIRAWSITVIILGIARYALVSYYKYRPHRFSTKQWSDYYHALTFSYAAAWASASLFFINNLPSDKEPVFVTLVLGMASGGALSNVSSRSLATFYCMSIVFCHSVKTFVEGNEGAYYLIAAEIFYIGLLSRVISRYNDLYNTSQNLSIRLQEKLEIEKELQKQKVQALQQSKLASLGEMAAGMAHEINNPLTVSVGKLKVLRALLSKQQDIPEKLMAQIDAIEKANKRAADIVGSIRNLSRIKDESELQVLKISELVELVRPLVSVKLDKFKVNLIEDYEDYEIRADKGELSQVLLNLLNNAIDAISKNEEENWIKICSQIQDDMVFIKVIDCGLSVNITETVKIFEPFYTTKDVGQGTGLGLSLSRSIMQRNGGNLHLDTSGVNTCFIISVKKK